MVKALLEIIKNQFTKKVEEIEVPRHEWLTPTQLFGHNCIGKLVEVPCFDPHYGGQTNVMGRVVSMSYDSFDRQTTLDIRGPHFTATVTLYPESMIKVYL